MARQSIKLGTMSYDVWIFEIDSDTFVHVKTSKNSNEYYW